MEFQKGAKLLLPSEELRYFRSVRRGQGEVRLFNRQGQEALGEVSEGAFLVKEVLRVSIPRYGLSVAVGFPENSVLPGIIRSCSELGAEKLILFGADRSQAISKRLQANPRFEKIALESARQCGRASPLQIEFRADLKSIPSSSNIHTWFFDESEAENVELGQSGDLKTTEALAIIGCEGGWTESERAFARSKGFSFVHFKTPILRVETAVTASVFYAIERICSQ